MKLITVALLVVGMLSQSMFAMAEGPVPFKALMQTAGAQPTTTQITASQDQSTAVPTRPAHGPMTRGGKMMTGFGTALFVIGGSVLVGAAVLNGAWGFSPSDKAKAYGAGSGAVAGGAILIVLGNRRRSAKSK
jgi:hypothetical protein